MKHVVLVAPYFGGSMLHCMRCFAGLEDIRLGIVTLEPDAAVPADLRPQIAGVFRVGNALDPAELVRATQAFQAEWGRVDRLEGYLEPMQVPLGDARDAAGIEGLGGAAARNFRDKHRMKRVLREAGLPVARQALVHGPDDARAFVAEVGYPVVLKPLDGAGARDTVRVVSDPDLASALNQLLPSPERPVQAEAFVRGDEHTMETVMIGGQAVWSSSSYYLPGPLRVLETPWEQYCILLPREQARPHVEAFRPTNAAALTALGMRDGLSHMEWFLTPDGPIVSEVGARPPGANIMRINSAAHGVDMWEVWARLLVHRTWDVPERQYAAGCVFLRAVGHGRTVGRLVGLEEVQRRIGEHVVSHQLPRPGQPRSAHYEGDGWVVVRHRDTDGVVAALRELVTTLHIEAA